MTRRPAATAATVSEDPLAEMLSAADARQDVLQLYDYDDPSRPAYIDKYPIESVRALGIEEFIQSKFGGGRYWVRIRRKSGKYGPSAVVNVAGEPKPRSSSTAAATTDATPASTSPWEKVLLTAVGAFAGAIAPVLAKKLLEGPPPPPDRVDELLKLANVLKPGGTSDPVAQMTAVIGMMKSMREFQQDLEPERGDGESRGNGGMISLLADSVPRLLKIVERKLDTDETRMRRRLPAGAAGATASTSDAGAAADVHASDAGAAAATSTDPLVLMLQSIPTPARAMLHQWAKQDLDPEAYADVVLDQFDDDTYEAMATQLVREDFVDVLLKTVPAYQAHREWFTKLVVAMRASVSGHADAEGSGNPGGSAVHSDTGSPPETKAIA